MVAHCPHLGALSFTSAASALSLRAADWSPISSAAFASASSFPVTTLKQWERVARICKRAGSILVLRFIQTLPAGWLVGPSVRPVQGRLPLAGADRKGFTSEAEGLRFETRAMGVVMNKCMDRSFAGTDRQLKATIGNHSQVAMPFLSVVGESQLLPVQVIESASFNGCLNEAARHSGLDDHEIAEALHICNGYMSRFMRSVAQAWAQRLVKFMRVTRSLAPLQWLAHQMGCDVVQRDSRAAEVAALQARLRELERAA